MITKKANSNNTTDVLYRNVIQGTKIYQRYDGTYLEDSQQPKPSNPNIYNPYEFTRFKNVILGSNKMAKMPRFLKDPKTGNVSSELVESNQHLPNLYSKREDCCGCSACYAICPVKKLLPNLGVGNHYYVKTEDDTELQIQYDFPHGAIYMEKDQEGFLYPVIDASLCIRCYKCIAVCPIATVAT